MLFDVAELMAMWHKHSCPEYWILLITFCGTAVSKRSCSQGRQIYQKLGLILLYRFPKCSNIKGVVFYQLFRPLYSVSIRQYSYAILFSAPIIVLSWQLSSQVITMFLCFAVKIGRPGYTVTKQYDPDTKQHSFLFEVSIYRACTSCSQSWSIEDLYMIN